MFASDQDNNIIKEEEGIYQVKFLKIKNYKLINLSNILVGHFGYLYLVIF
jgi:hypothetical protein